MAIQQRRWFVLGLVHRIAVESQIIAERTGEARQTQQRIQILVPGGKNWENLLIF